MDSAEEHIDAQDIVLCRSAIFYAQCCLSACDIMIDHGVDELLLVCCIFKEIVIDSSIFMKNFSCSLCVRFAMFKRYRIDKLIRFFPEVFPFLDRILMAMSLLFISMTTLSRWSSVSFRHLITSTYCFIPASLDIINITLS